MLWVILPARGMQWNIAPADISRLKLSEHMGISNNFSSEVTPTTGADWVEIDVGKPNENYQVHVLYRKVWFPAKFSWDCGRLTVTQRTGRH